jgi:hypothetical protein
VNANRFRIAVFSALYVLSLVAVPLASRAVAASSTTFSGQATVVSGTVVGLPVTLVDTGPVEAGGGSLHRSLFRYPDGLPDVTGGALQAEVLHASVVAQGDRSRAEATVADLQLTAANHTIRASFLAARATATCNGNSATISASSEIADLTIDNETIMVATGATETIPLPGGQIVINEQVGSATAGDGDVTVNALHVTLTDPITQESTDIVIASAHADIHCAQSQPGACGPKDFVTGGGWITDTPSGARANFAVAGADGGWGHFLYIDHGAGGPRVKGTAVLTYTSTGPTSRHIHGTADIDGRAGSYDVDVADNGEPGHELDTFALLLSTGYGSGGKLKGGNIQLHCK